jgi:hypothetical protein
MAPQVPCQVPTAVHTIKYELDIYNPQAMVLRTRMGGDGRISVGRQRLILSRDARLVTGLGGEPSAGEAVSH